MFKSIEDLVFNMVSIARKNLFHDKVRLFTSLIALSVSFFMIFFALGMALGTLQGMVVIIDQTGVDIWVISEGNEHFHSPNPHLISEDLITDVKSIEGIETCYPLIYSNAIAVEEENNLAVKLVGCNISSKIATPWEMIEGNINDLSQNRSIIIDKSLTTSFGDLALNDEIEVNGLSHKIVGICKNSKDFIFPMIFTDYSNAKNISMETANTTNFFLVNATEGYNLDNIIGQISEIDGIDGFLSSEVRKGTISYMIFESGMGLGTIFMSFIATVVGVIIIAITIYTATMERIPEYGTLKAIGASKGVFYKILSEQVLWIVTLGFIVGIILSTITFAIINQTTLMPVLLSSYVVIGTYFLILILSTLTSFMSARKVNKIDPSIVFRGL